MAIKVSIDNNYYYEPKEKPFPKLMKHKKSGSIGLFISRTSGVCILSKGSTSMGVRIIIYPGNWEDYNEPVTLVNE